MNNIEFNNVSKYYGTHRALDRVSLGLPAGKISCIMGLSGSGKSTLLRHINRLLEPSEGEILIEGKNLAAFDAHALQQFRRNQVSMVFQHFGLLPHLSVIENIEYGLKVKGVKRPERRKRALCWLNEVGLTDNAQSPVQALSGGMKQRVGIARAFACDTPILLMDEPFSALDPITRQALQTLLLTLQAKWRKTIVFVSHDLDEVRLLSDFVVLLERGRVVQSGTFEQLQNHPNSDYTAQFMQKRIADENNP
ncbi:ATP-binding cassette domain-containing protein [Necropsobacter rosorum]|uniref:ATP-binding cassette domain-containing protein n=1 Tax=Necropsobacter rosorum TaxID=908285 RepID=UPI000691CADA